MSGEGRLHGLFERVLQSVVRPHVDPVAFVRCAERRDAPHELPALCAIDDRTACGVLLSNRSRWAALRSLEHGVERAADVRCRGADDDVRLHRAEIAGIAVDAYAACR